MILRFSRMIHKRGFVCAFHFSMIQHKKAFFNTLHRMSVKIIFIYIFGEVLGTEAHPSLETQMWNITEFQQ